MVLHSTLGAPRGGLATAAEGLTRLAVPLLTVLASASVCANACGHFTMVWLGSCSLLPFLALAGVAAALPTAGVPTRRRLAIAGLVALFISIPLTNWPLRLIFEAHRKALDRRVAIERASSGPTEGPVAVGLMRFHAVRKRPERPAIGFQLAGDTSGGIYLVCPEPGGGPMWRNTNWEVDLGNGWWMVEED